MYNSEKNVDIRRYIVVFTYDKDTTDYVSMYATFMESEFARTDIDGELDILTYVDTNDNEKEYDSVPAITMKKKKYILEDFISQDVDGVIMEDSSSGTYGDLEIIANSADEDIANLCIGMIQVTDFNPNLGFQIERVTPFGNVYSNLLDDTEEGVNNE